MADAAKPNSNSNAEFEYLSEDEVNPKAIFDVTKQGHVPGIYERDHDQNKVEQKRNIEEESGGDEQESEKRISVSSIIGIFGKSMTVIPFLSEDDLDNCSKPKPSPVAPKPITVQLVDTLPSSKVSNDAPTPKPRGRQKSPMFGINGYNFRPVPKPRIRRDVKKTMSTNESFDNKSIEWEEISSKLKFHDELHEKTIDNDSNKELVWEAARQEIDINSSTNGISNSSNNLNMVESIVVIQNESFGDNIGQVGYKSIDCTVTSKDHKRFTVSEKTNFDIFSPSRPSNHCEEVFRDAEVEVVKANDYGSYEANIENDAGIVEIDNVLRLQHDDDVNAVTNDQQNMENTNMESLETKDSDEYHQSPVSLETYSNEYDKEYFMHASQQKNTRNAKNEETIKTDFFKRQHNDDVNDVANDQQNMRNTKMESLETKDSDEYQQSPVSLESYSCEYEKEYSMHASQQKNARNGKYEENIELDFLKQQHNDDVNDVANDQQNMEATHMESLETKDSDEYQHSPPLSMMPNSQVVLESLESYSNEYDKEYFMHASQQKNTRNAENEETIKTDFFKRQHNDDVNDVANDQQNMRNTNMESLETKDSDEYQQSPVSLESYSCEYEKEYSMHASQQKNARNGKYEENIELDFLKQQHNDDVNDVANDQQNMEATHMESLETKDSDEYQHSPPLSMMPNSQVVLESLESYSNEYDKEYFMHASQQKNTRNARNAKNEETIKTDFFKQQHYDDVNDVANDQQNMRNTNMESLETKDSDEYQQSLNDSAPTPVMPNSEVVLESLESYSYEHEKEVNRRADHSNSPCDSPGYVSRDKVPKIVTDPSSFRPTSTTKTSWNVSSDNVPKGETDSPSSKSTSTKTPFGHVEQVYHTPKSTKLTKRHVSTKSATKEEKTGLQQSLIFLSGINPDNKEENLRNFVESASKGTLDEIIYNYSKTSTLVTVNGDSNPDLAKLRNKVDTNGFEGYKPEIVEMPLPTSIAVSSLGNINSPEVLGLYFESKRANGGYIMKDPYESKDGTCYIVEFGNHEVVRRICQKRDHKLDLTSLRVSPFYQCDVGEIWDAMLHTVTIPAAITIELGELKIKFLQKKCCEDFSTILRDTFCMVTFSRDRLQLDCLLTPKNKGYKKLAEVWQDNARDALHKYIEDTVKEGTVKSNERLEKEFNDTDQLVASPCATSYKVKIVGLEESVKECSEKLELKHKEVKKRLNRRKSTIRKSALELEVIKKLKILDKFQDDIDDLSVENDLDSVTIEAQPVDINTVILGIVECSNDIEYRSWRHNWSSFCVPFVLQTLKPKISNAFEDMGIILSWTIRDEAVDFCVYKGCKSTFSEMAKMERSDGDNIGDTVIELFQYLIIEKEVTCDKDSVDLFRSKEWTSFTETVTETYKKSAEIKDNVDNVLVYGLRSEVFELKREVEQFLKRRSVFKSQIDCKAVELKFMDKHMPGFLSSLENKYASDRLHLLRKGNKIDVLATKEGLERVEFEFYKFQKSFVSEQYTVERVCVKEAKRDEFEQGVLHTIEKYTRCIIELTGEDVTPEDLRSDLVLEGAVRGHTIPKSETTPSEFNSDPIRLVKGELHEQDTFHSTENPMKSSRYNADSFNIGKIKLTVTIGDLLEQTTDVIVHTVGNYFDFIGEVSQTLAKRCPSVVKESKKQEKLTELQEKNIVRTGCRELAAKWIFHVRYTEILREWRGRLLLCLEKADRHRLKSIAFPLIGTGQAFKQFSPDDIAGCMFDAIDEYEKTATFVHVKDIRVIVFNRQPQQCEMIKRTFHRRIMEAANPPNVLLSGYLSRGLAGVQKWYHKFTRSDMKPDERNKIKKETSSMTLQIYSNKTENIKNCKNELDARLGGMYSKKIVNDYIELVKKLTQEEKDLLDIPALVNINIDSKTGIITVDGPSKLVDETRFEIQLKLLKVERARNEAENAKQLYGIAQWHYEEVMQDGTMKPKPYNQELNFKIEEAYKGNKPDIRFQTDGKTYVIDFKQLVEYDQDDDQDTVRVIRKDILKEYKGALPDDWTAMKDNQNLISVALNSTDPKYKTIEQKFIQEVKNGAYSHRVQFSFDPTNLKVTKIERVQNKILYQQYQAKKKQLSDQKPNLPPNMPIERDLWHGMKPDVIASIQNHGFNRSYSGDANGKPWFGDGVYFAGDASYSCRGWLTGAKPGIKTHVFLVNVLTGQFCQGTQGMRYLPVVDKAKPTVMYDSAVDKLASPYEFVIFNDTQAYPAYLVTFTS